MLENGSEMLEGDNWVIYGRSHRGGCLDGGEGEVREGEGGFERLLDISRYLR